VQTSSASNRLVEHFTPWRRTSVWLRRDMGNALEHRRSSWTTTRGIVKVNRCRLTDEKCGTTSATTRFPTPAVRQGYQSIGCAAVHRQSMRGMRGRALVWKKTGRRSAACTVRRNGGFRDELEVLWLHAQ